MSRHIRQLGLATLLALACVPTAGASDQAATIDKSESVLKEIMAIPARRIPADLLHSAHGVVIIPDVIKIGFIAGVRRGHGVLLAKDADGDWNLPQFLTLTGGSIGWQAGAQATDVVLVLRSAKSVTQITRGTLTIGADAAAAAGPVGRNAAAATDIQMKAEILSYSRSRGLFAGVSLDGSVIELNAQRGREYYGDPSTNRPAPAAAVRLMQTVANLAGSGRVATPDAVSDTEQLRRDLAASAQSLNAVLPADWQRFLAMPQGIYGVGPAPTAESLNLARANFDRVNSDPSFAALKARPEFQATFDLLRDYQAALSRPPVIPLPPPPPSR